MPDSPEVRLGETVQGRRAGSAEPRRPPSLLVNFAIVWIVGLVVRGILSFAITKSVVPAPELPALERLGLLCYGFISRSPGVLTIAACLTGIVAPFPRTPRLAVVAIRTVCWTVASAIELFGFSSWAAFYSTGQFLNAEAWSLAASSTSLLLAHIVEMEPWAFVVVPATAAGVLLTTRRLCRWATRWSPRRARAVVGGLAGFLAVSLVVAWVGDLASEREPLPVAVAVGSTPESAHAAYVDFAEERSGPIARVLADLWAGMSRAGVRLMAMAGVSPEGKPVTDGERYRERVNTHAMRRLSVVVVIFESLRADEVSTAGRRVVMPAVEQLAREGTVYTNAIAPAGQTDYATTSILSSQFPLRHVAFHAFPEHVTYPHVLLYDVLKPLGYRTAVFSSQNEHWAGMYNFLNTGGVEHFHHADNYAGPTYVPETDRGFRKWMETTGHAGKVDDRYTVDEAIAWTDSIAPSAPFFAYINLQTSHTPYLRPAGFAPRFGTGQTSFPILFDVYPPDSAPAVRDMYDNSLAYADLQLGRLVEALKRSGRWNSTLMVVIGDHGEAFFEHGFAAHGSELYAEVSHVPMIVRTPGVRPRRDTLPASGMDIPPTVLSLLHLPPYPAFQGIDLADPAARRHRPIFTLSQTALADEVAIEQDGWALLYDLRHAQVHLFDRMHDPLERHDVAATFPVARDALLQTIAAWWTTQLDYYRAPREGPLRFQPPAPRPPAIAPPPRH